MENGACRTFDKADWPKMSIAMRTLATRRLEAVRQSLTRAGIDATRLPGTARRNPLVEAAGHPRIEFDLRS